MKHLYFSLCLLTSAVHAADFRDLLGAHCLECHDSDAKKGGLDLSTFTDEAAVMKDRMIWRSV
jgi:Planctomycete cytochrome C